MIEHYPVPRNLDADGDPLDLVELVDGEPVWRRVWPRRFDAPGYGQAVAWMREHGYRMLAS